MVFAYFRTDADNVFDFAFDELNYLEFLREPEHVANSDSDSYAYSDTYSGTRPIYLHQLGREVERTRSNSSDPGNIAFLD